MNRFPLLALALALGSTASAVSTACSEDVGSGGIFLASADAGRDGSKVTVDDASAGTDAAPPGVAPSCSRYCELIAENCTGVFEQYASEAACLAFCRHLEPGAAGVTGLNSLACRQYYAGNPARTSPAESCKAAGPFGGGDKCGDRCTAFCEVTLSACGAGGAAYPTEPACKNACAMYTYVEDGADGGGEGPLGPTGGNTLNCRLYWLREAAADAGACPLLGILSASCN